MSWSIKGIEQQEVIEGNGLARYCRWNVNNKILETPALFVSHWLGSSPTPWEIMELKTFLISAYDIYCKKKSYTDILAKGIHQFLAEKSPLFDPKETVILMDSGGFSLLKTIDDIELTKHKLKQRLKKIQGKQALLRRLYAEQQQIADLMKEETSIEEELLKLSNKSQKQKELVKDFSQDLYDLYTGAKPDLAVVLDYPFDPRKSDAYERYRFSKKNILDMCRWKIPLDGCNLTIIPVIHPIAKELLHDLFKRRPYVQQPSTLTFVDDEEIQTAIKDIPALGIGSLIPLLMHRAKGGREAVIRFLFDLRTKYYPNSFLHGFGIGGTTTMHLAYYLGADSVDCAGWRRRAVYGIVQLVGTGDRYITQRTRDRLKWKGIPALKDDDLRDFEDCKCPAHRKGFSIEDFDVFSPGSFTLRAIHNLYIYVQEVREAQKSIQNAEYESFVEERLSRSKIHRKLFDFAKKRVHDYWREKRQRGLTQTLDRW